MLKDKTLNLMLVGAVVFLVGIIAIAIYDATSEKAVCGGCNLCNGKIIEESTKTSAITQNRTITAHSEVRTIAEITFETEEVCFEESGDVVGDVVDGLSSYPIYKVDGIIIDENLQTYLMLCLRDLGHEEFYEFALCQIYQESRGDVNAVNPNGKDKGILQFREIYWDEYRENEGLHTAAVMDPFAQIYVYTRVMARRLDGGLPVNEAISRHYTSDYGSYNEKYVADVMQWFDTLERVK